MPTDKPLLRAVERLGVPVSALATTLQLDERRLRGILHGACCSAVEFHTVSCWLAEHDVDIEAAWAKHNLPKFVLPTFLALRREGVTPDPVSPKPNTQSPEEDVHPMAIPRPFLTYECLAHFGLTDDPFDMPENGTIFRPPSLAHIEKTLLRAAEGRQLLALVGEPGSGKSTILRKVCATLAARPGCNLVRPGIFDRGALTGESLATALMRDAQLVTQPKSKESRSQQLLEMLTRRAAAGELTCLVIDEAHDIPDDGLIAIKRLWDTVGNPLGILLVGQPLLKRRLANNEVLREVTLRTRVVDLPAFKAPEVQGYLEWRFAQAGSKTLPFTADAVHALAKTGGAVPLSINNLAAAAMNTAYRAGDKLVSSQHIRAA
ncbi:AAA family ATPase [Myxococcota bacterium]|nr:AAA family ATPase [Myxococcota bacterium]